MPVVSFTGTDAIANGKPGLVVKPALVNLTSGVISLQGLYIVFILLWFRAQQTLPSSESPQLLPVTLDAAAVQTEPPTENPEALSISCEITFRHGTLRLNGTVSEKLLTLLIQELKR